MGCAARAADRRSRQPRQCRTRIHPRRGAFARGSQLGVSARYLDPCRQPARIERVYRRLDLVRCRLGRQPRLGLWPVSLLRLPEPPRTRHSIRCAIRHRYRRIQHRRLLGPLLFRATLVSARRLLDASATAAASPRASARGAAPGRPAPGRPAPGRPVPASATSAAPARTAAASGQAGDHAAQTSASGHGPPTAGPPSGRPPSGRPPAGRPPKSLSVRSDSA